MMKKTIISIVTGAALLVSGWFVWPEQAPPVDSFQELVISENWHKARPYWKSYEKRERLELKHVFTDSAPYTLPGPDQKDWNKLTGLSLHWWTNHKNSAMVSWRYNPADSLFELGFYYHKDWQPIRAKTSEEIEVFARAKTAQGVETYINVQKEIGVIGMTIITPLDTAFYEVDFALNLDRKLRVINPWFGGSRRAPHDIYLLRKQIK